jgi:hypothetical protein
VVALGPRNIYKVFAGGNHSWVVLDDIIPVREKYRPPSPLPERPPSLSQSPRARSKSRSSKSATRKYNIAPKSNESNFFVDLTYSPDSNMVHRFINFEI